jgi:hypothetical protein
LGRWLRQLRRRDFTTTNDFARKGSDSPESRDFTTINNDNNYTAVKKKSLEGTVRELIRGPWADGLDSLGSRNFKTTNDFESKGLG